MPNLVSVINVNINVIILVQVKGGFIRFKFWLNVTAGLCTSWTLMFSQSLTGDFYFLYYLWTSTFQEMRDFLIWAPVKGVKTEPFQLHLSIKKQMGAFPDRLLYAQKSRWGQSDTTPGPSLNYSRNKTVKRSFYWSAGWESTIVVVRAGYPVAPKSEIISKIFTICW